MKTKKANIMPAGFLLMLLFSASAAYATESPATGLTPVAVMPTTAFEFAPVVEGESITHDFLIQNRGDADLTVLDVKTT